MTRIAFVLSLIAAALASSAAACTDTSEPTTTSSGSGTSGHGSGGGGSGAGGSGAGGSGAGGHPAWSEPACAAVTGTRAVTFTRDEGKTLAPTDGPLSGNVDTSLAALDTPNTLLAESEKSILESVDAGCTWTTLGAVDDDSARLAAAPGGRAYIWGLSAGDPLYRVEAASKIIPVTSPVTRMLGLGVDPHDGMHLRVSDKDTVQLQDSTDGGVTWKPIGKPAIDPGSLYDAYDVAFDPNDLDHVVFGQSGLGISVSTDGGGTWTPATGLGAMVNVFTVVISPRDGQIVWAEGIVVGPDSRHIWRSEDGGKSFAPVVTDTNEITLTNGLLMAPHPMNTDVLYFVFGTVLNDHGTDLYRYDQASGKVTMNNNSYSNMTAIVFSPVNPEVMYLGLASRKH